MPATGVMAREVVEAYGAQVGNHPVGTGPFKIASWKRSDQIILLANRDFRPTEFQGKRLPILDRIDIKIVEEYQSRVLGFLNGEFDFLEQLPESMKEMVLTDDAKLKPELARKGIVLAPFPVLQTYYMWMNMDDPVIGGYSKEKVALRRAIALGYNRDEDISTMKKGLALPPSRRCRRMCWATIRSTAARWLTIRRWPMRCWTVTAIVSRLTVFARSPTASRSHW
jgi:ABC-type transport system substrate-binding protein